MNQIKQLPFDILPVVQTKKCSECKKEVSLSDFSKHSGRKDGLDTRCDPCKSHGKKSLRRIKKHAPPKPEKCEICVEIPETSFHCDHNHEMETFRGWLCRDCNHKHVMFEYGGKRAMQHFEYQLIRENYPDPVIEAFNNFKLSMEKYYHESE